MPRAREDERSSRIHKETPRYRRELQAFGRRVRKLREEQDLTLEKASERSDLDLKHFQKIESGQINVSFVSILRLAIGLRVPLAALFGPSTKPSKRRPSSTRGKP